MKYLENNNIKNDVIYKLIDELSCYEDTEHYGRDLSFDLFESYNIDGTITYNRYDANEYLQTHFNNLGEIVKEIKSQGIEINTADIFDNPENFMTLIFLEVASYVMSECKFVSDNRNNKITLDSKNIEIIENELREMIENV